MESYGLVRGNLAVILLERCVLLESNFFFVNSFWQKFC